MTEKPNRTAEMADILHQASMLYMASNFPIDYGTGTKYTSVEVHMLKYIIDHPGKQSPSSPANGTAPSRRSPRC